MEMRSVSFGFSSESDTILGFSAVALLHLSPQGTGSPLRTVRPNARHSSVHSQWHEFHRVGMSRSGSAPRWDRVASAGHALLCTNLFRSLVHDINSCTGRQRPHAG